MGALAGRWQNLAGAMADPLQTEIVTCPLSSELAPKCQSLKRWFRQKSENNTIGPCNGRAPSRTMRQVGLPPRPLHCLLPPWVYSRPGISQPSCLEKEAVMRKVFAVVLV